jgi:peroxiredoxin
MTELVQLERRHEDFSKRNARVMAISVEGLDDTRKTQADFPHLTALSDEARSLSEAAALIHPHAAPDGGDVDAPTTMLVDRRGTVRWLYRSPSVIARLSPDDVLQALDQTSRAPVGSSGGG